VPLASAAVEIEVWFCVRVLGAEPKGMERQSGSGSGGGLRVYPTPPVADKEGKPEFTKSKC